MQAGYEAYRLLTLAIEPGPIVSSSGVRLVPDYIIGETDIEIDTLLVAGAPGVAERRLSPRLVAQVAYTATKARRCGSVCTGAFVLAATGLLARRSKGDDALVRRAAARRDVSGDQCGRGCDPRSRRPILDRRWRHGGAGPCPSARGGRSRPRDREAGRQPARDVLQAVGRPDAVQPQEGGPSCRPLRIAGGPTLGREQSGRGLERAGAGAANGHHAAPFRAAVSCRSSVRIEAARRLLEEGNEPPKQVATHCGFADADTLRRAFQRQMGVTPAEYRKHHGQIASD